MLYSFWWGYNSKALPLSQEVVELVFCDVIHLLLLFC